MAITEDVHLLKYAMQIISDYFRIKLVNPPARWSGGSVTDITPFAPLAVLIRA